MHLLVVVEVAINVAGGTLGWRAGHNQLRVFHLAALAPTHDALLPAAQGVRGVAAAVQFHVAVQAHVDKVGGDIFDIRPFACTVGHYQRNTVFAQQLDEGFT
ncbi:hypothetical protein D3C79_817310 [compost metagenome]